MQCSCAASDEVGTPSRGSERSFASPSSITPVQRNSVSSNGGIATINIPKFESNDCEDAMRMLREELILATERLKDNEKTINCLKVLMEKSNYFKVLITIYFLSMSVGRASHASPAVRFPVQPHGDTFLRHVEGGEIRGLRRPSLAFSHHTGPQRRAARIITGTGQS